MTAFFIRTDRSVAGPFTGVELREAALAGILRHDGIVGGSPEGPWFYASDAGLFSEKKLPLPHPPDTYVPQYQVRGMPGAFQGPFKLRELIGFAARGMLPAEALLQSDDSDEWIAARRFRVLAAVMSGELVLLDGAGKVLVRSGSADSGQANGVVSARAPIEVASAADMTHATSLAPPVSDGDAEPQAAWRAPQPIAVEEETIHAPSRLSILWSRCRERLPALRLSIPPRLALQLGCLVLVFAGVASAVSYWKQMRLQRAQVIGDWIAFSNADESSDPAFGLSLREDGRCVIFNTKGPCWSGDFVWDQRSDDQDGFEHIAPFSSVFDEVSPSHESGVIEPTDGYIRLQGFVKDPPMLDGHEVRDLFLRRDGPTLRIGYLAAVHWTEEKKTMEAGWISAHALTTRRPDIAADLQALKVELPVPTVDFGGERPLHISEAITAVRAGISTKVDNQETTLHECLAYSNMVNAAFLLKKYGLPDEARRIYRFEIPSLRNGPSFEDAQIVRYDELKFILSSDGQIRYLTWFDQPNL